ncbi:nucleotide-binding alpha-beta plait domain-containing protein [Tanacetum coccineum]
MIDGSAMPSDNDHPASSLLQKKLKKIDKFASIDIIQKAHVKWDIEGDAVSIMLFEEAVGNGLINCVNIKNSTINVSHLSSIMATMLVVLHCDILLNPFNYLVIPIGFNMKSIVASLEDSLLIVFHMRLSSGKLILLSIGVSDTIKSDAGSLGGRGSKDLYFHLHNEFPLFVNAKDLWRVSNQYGTVVDTFIPDKKSKANKRYGFVRFIKADNVERLVSNLCTIWVGKFRLHANIARFQRKPLNRNSSQTYKIQTNKHGQKDVSIMKAANGFVGSFAHAVKKRTKSHYEEVESQRALVLDESCLNQSDMSTDG